MRNNIYIYHIPGVKIGVTRNLFNRVTKQQGYKPGEYAVLETSEDIEYISRREKELQKEYGFKTDYNSYSKLNKQNSKPKRMRINITDQTTTFPTPIKELDSYLSNNLGFKFATSLRGHVLDDLTAQWINNNARVSHYDPSRCYVYNKSLAAFADEQDLEEKFTSGDTTKIPEKSVFKRIRTWASSRGIYEKGDSKTQVVKLMEELGEVSRAILKNDKAEIKDGIGDMIVVLTNLAALEGFMVEDCIEAAYDVIKDRKGKMDNGTFKKETL